MRFRVDGGYPQVAGILGRSVFELDISAAPTKLPLQTTGDRFGPATMPLKAGRKPYPRGAEGIVRRQWKEKAPTTIATEIKQTQDDWKIYDSYLRECLATMRRDNILLATGLIERTLKIDRDHLAKTAGITHPHLGWLASEQISVVLAVIILNEKYQRPDDQEVSRNIKTLLQTWQLRLNPSQYQRLTEMHTKRGAAWYVPRP